MAWWPRPDRAVRGPGPRFVSRDVRPVSTRTDPQSFAVRFRLSAARSIGLLVARKGAASVRAARWLHQLDLDGEADETRRVLDNLVAAQRFRIRRRRLGFPCRREPSPDRLCELIEGIAARLARANAERGRATIRDAAEGQTSVSRCAVIILAVRSRSQMYTSGYRGRRTAGSMCRWCLAATTVAAVALPLADRASVATPDATGWISTFGYPTSSGDPVSAPEHGDTTLPRLGETTTDGAYVERLTFVLENDTVLSRLWFLASDLARIRTVEELRDVCYEVSSLPTQSLTPGPPPFDGDWASTYLSRLNNAAEFSYRKHIAGMDRQSRPTPSTAAACRRIYRGRGELGCRDARRRGAPISPLN